MLTQNTILTERKTDFQILIYLKNNSIAPQYKTDTNYTELALSYWTGNNPKITQYLGRQGFPSHWEHFRSFFLIFLSLGCDKVLNSSLVEDPCGVCGGDGSTCRTRERQYKGTVTQEQGRKKIAFLPKGARLIRIQIKELEVNICSTTVLKTAVPEYRRRLSQLYAIADIFFLF